MRAVLADPSADRLTVADDLEDPVARPGQLLVRVRAAALNRADLLARRGAYRRGTSGVAETSSFIAGSELAGDVIDVGEGAEGWSPGDRVMALGPGYAELAAVSASTALRVPDELSWEEAGALPVGLFTMHDALVTNGRFVAGQSVLVNAATSGVGVVGVRLAAELGASVVFATSRSADKLNVLADFLGPMPCPVVYVDTTSSDLVAASLDHTIGSGVDVIIDNVGASALASNLDAIAIRGHIVQVGRLGGRTAELDLDELARKRVSLVGVTFRTRTADDVAAVVSAASRDAGHLLPRLAPRVDRTFPLVDAEAAQAAMAQDAHVGKIVLVP